MQLSNIDMITNIELSNPDSRRGLDWVYTFRRWILDHATCQKHTKKIWSSTACTNLSNQTYTRLGYSRGEDTRKKVGGMGIAGGGNGEGWSQEMGVRCNLLVRWSDLTNTFLIKSGFFKKNHLNKYMEWWKDLVVSTIETSKYSILVPSSKSLFY